MMDVTDDELELAFEQTFGTLDDSGNFTPPTSKLTHTATKHDFIFFEKRSTPKVITQGMKFTAPEAYGKQTKRRAATEAEEKQIASGQWVRVDEKGKKGGQPGYKKTKMVGREHLVSHGENSERDMSFNENDMEDFLEHHGIKGMKWGQRKAIKEALSNQSLKYTYNKDKRKFDLNRDPTTSEIYAARKKQNDARSKLKALDSRPENKYNKSDREKDTAAGKEWLVRPKVKITKAHDTLLNTILNDDSRSIAEYKTRGEKMAAFLLAGGYGLHVTSNTDKALAKRYANHRLYQQYKVREPKS